MIVVIEHRHSLLMVLMLTEVPMLERSVPVVDVKRRKSSRNGKRCRREKA
jgi:hypothetical protein